jgi:hypothetical protein
MPLSACAAELQILTAFRRASRERKGINKDRL